MMLVENLTDINSFGWSEATQWINHAHQANKAFDVISMLKSLYFILISFSIYLFFLI